MDPVIPCVSAVGVERFGSKRGVCPVDQVAKDWQVHFGTIGGHQTGENRGDNGFLQGPDSPEPEVAILVDNVVDGSQAFPDRMASGTRPTRPICSPCVEDRSYFRPPGSKDVVVEAKYDGYLRVLVVLFHFEQLGTVVVVCPILSETQNIAPHVLVSLASTSFEHEVKLVFGCDGHFPVDGGDVDILRFSPYMADGTVLWRWGEFFQIILIT